MADCGSSLGGHKSSTLLSPSPPRLFQRTAEKRPPVIFADSGVRIKVTSSAATTAAAATTTLPASAPRAPASQDELHERELHGLHRQLFSLFGAVAAHPSSPDLPSLGTHPRSGSLRHSRVAFRPRTSHAATGSRESPIDSDLSPPRTQGEEEDQATFAMGTRHIRGIRFVAPLNGKGLATSGSGSVHRHTQTPNPSVLDPRVPPSPPSTSDDGAGGS